VVIINRSLQEFVRSSIDYAGLFPPASLSLETAIRNYASYLSRDNYGILERFVIPAARLNELGRFIHLFSKDQVLSLSILGQRTNILANDLSSITKELGIVESFRKRFNGIVNIGIFEIALPASSIAMPLLGDILAKTTECGLTTFCEIILPLDSPNWEFHVLSALDVLAEHNSTENPSLGFKLRTGGVTKDSFPSPMQVAIALNGCRDRGITMKFTAGLHHPIRMYRDEVGTRMHGFINVFAAGMLASVYDLNVPEVEEVLKDETASNFSFTESELKWRNLTVPIADIRRFRTTTFYSYGCCSFEEPANELSNLGFIS
jgi:hypothetical protein